jgi:hypothetical protein
MADLLYNSEAALRLVVNELGALRRRTSPRGKLLCDDEVPFAAGDDQPAVQGAEPAVRDRP